MRLTLALLFAVLLAGCATTGGSARLDERDPYEGLNRGIWAFNDAVDTVAIKPATKVYRTVTPVPARRGLSRVFANLAEPFSFINNLLQGKPDRAFNSLGRFLINSTIGVGGLADHATDLGLAETREDFGQTLAVGGARKSPYLVLPIFGPSTVRDAVGTAVQLATDPARLVMRSELGTDERTVITGVQVLDTRSGLIESGADAVLETSADPYAAARSAYFQRRNAQIRDAEDAPPADEEERLLNEALDEEATEEKAEPPTGENPAAPDPTAPLPEDDSVAAGD